MRSSRQQWRAVVLLCAAALLAGCASAPVVPSVNGGPVKTHNPELGGPLQGMGVEANDIVSMSDRMVRDMLSEPRLVTATQGKAPRVIIDAQYFVNDSSQVINRNAITDRMRVALNRAAQGRMAFIGRQYATAVQAERDLKRSGMTDVGTVGMTKAAMGADYRLGGRINTTEQLSPRTGIMQRYTLITFEMFDVETGEIVWSNMYEMLRSGSDDIIYR